MTLLCNICDIKHLSFQTKTTKTRTTLPNFMHKHIMFEEYIKQMFEKTKAIIIYRLCICRSMVAC